MTVYAITDTKNGEHGLRLLIFKLPDRLYTNSRWPDRHYNTVKATICRYLAAYWQPSTSSNSCNQEDSSAIIALSVGSASGTLY